MVLHSLLYSIYQIRYLLPLIVSYPWLCLGFLVDIFLVLFCLLFVYFEYTIFPHLEFCSLLLILVLLLFAMYLCLPVQVLHFVLLVNFLILWFVARFVLLYLDLYLLLLCCWLYLCCLELYSDLLLFRWLLCLDFRYFR